MIDYDEIIREMEEIYGPLPDPDFLPKVFEYYVRLYKYFHYNKE